MNIIIEGDAQSSRGGLWLGDLGAAARLEDLLGAGINRVLTVIGKCYLDDLVKKYGANGIQHKIIITEDDHRSKIDGFLEEATHFIRDGQAAGNVLVHCFAGSSRSSSMVIAYLIKYQKMSFDEALKMCREKRDIVWPNIWFVKQLRVWEEKVLASEEVKIKEN